MHKKPHYSVSDRRNTTIRMASIVEAKLSSTIFFRNVYSSIIRNNYLCNTDDHETSNVSWIIFYVEFGLQMTKYNKKMLKFYLYIYIIFCITWRLCLIYLNSNIVNCFFLYTYKVKSAMSKFKEHRFYSTPTKQKDHP